MPFLKHKIDQDCGKADEAVAVCERGEASVAQDAYRELRRELRRAGQGGLYWFLVPPQPYSASLEIFCFATDIADLSTTNTFFRAYYMASTPAFLRKPPPPRGTQFLKQGGSLHTKDSRHIAVWTPPAWWGLPANQAETQTAKNHQYGRNHPTTLAFLSKVFVSFSLYVRPRRRERCRLLV